MFRYLNVGDGNLSSKKVKKCTGRVTCKVEANILSSVAF